MTMHTASRKLNSLEIPPLENGDHLTQAEFHRRYCEMPEVKKAELIDGVVFMGSPVSTEFHSEPHEDLGFCFSFYKCATPGLRTGGNGTVILDDKNEVQPDLILMKRVEVGGEDLSPKGYVVTAPELVAEIAATTSSIDLGRKKVLYQKHRVKEYVVWRVRQETIDWFVLRAGKFQPLKPVEGVYRSRVFPGLWIGIDDLLAGNLPGLQRTLQQGIDSPEHAAFVAKLEAQRP